MAASLSSIFSCTLASLLPPFWGSLSLRFGNGFGFRVWNRSICFGSVSGCGFSCTTGQNAVRFCFLLFAWVRYVLGSAPRREPKIARKDLSAVLAGTRSPFFMVFLLVRMDNSEQRGFALVLRLAFMGSLFLRFRFCIVNSGKQTGLLVRNVRFWLASPGSSSSFSSSSSSPVACRRNRRLHLLFRRLDDASSPPSSRRFFLPKSSGCCSVFLLLSRPCFVSKKRYRTG